MSSPPPAPMLSDGTVTLRPLMPEDAPRIVEQCRDPETLAWTTVPHPYGREDADEFIGVFAPRHWEAGTDLTLAVEYAGRYAGTVSVRPRPSGEGDLGFVLHPDRRGKGIMRVALDLLLDWSFGELGLTVAHWRAHVGNWDSRRVVWATGFSFGPTIPKLLAGRDGERVDGWTAWIGADDPRTPTEPWRGLPMLLSDRLRLRGWTEEDGPALVETAADAWYQRFVPNGPLPTTAAAVPAYVARVQLAAIRGDRLAWCVADGDTGRVLGNVALFDLAGRDGEQEAQVGFWAHPRGRGRGVMTEAVRRVADWAFDDGGIRRLYLLTGAGNGASRRLAERCGFVHVGTERQSTLVPGGYDDTAVYDLLHDDR